MKFQLELWERWRLALEFARHSRSDRYTIRIGRVGISILVSAWFPHKDPPQLSSLYDCAPYPHHEAKRDALSQSRELMRFAIGCAIACSALALILFLVVAAMI